MKAKNVELGDVIGLHVYGEVVAVRKNGKHVTLKLALENQGAGQRAVATSGRGRGEPGSCNSLEWTDDGCIVEFIVKQGRELSVYRDDDDRDDDEEIEPVDPVAPELVD